MSVRIIFTLAANYDTGRLKYNNVYRINYSSRRSSSVGINFFFFFGSNTIRSITLARHLMPSPCAGVSHDLWDLKRNGKLTDSHFADQRIRSIWVKNRQKLCRTKTYFRNFLHIDGVRFDRSFSFGRYSRTTYFSIVSFFNYYFKVTMYFEEFYSANRDFQKAMILSPDAYCAQIFSTWQRTFA